MGKKFAIEGGTVDDFLNIESSVCDAATQSLRDIAPIQFLVQASGGGDAWDM